MIDWYHKTHAWNRIALTGLAVAMLLKASLGAMTVAHMIGLPVGAVVFWAIGWAVVGVWHLARNSLPGPVAGHA